MNKLKAIEEKLLKNRSKLDAMGLSLEVGAKVYVDGNPGFIVTLLSLGEVLVRDKATGHTRKVPVSVIQGEESSQVRPSEIFNVSDKEWNEALRRYDCIQKLSSLDWDPSEVDRQAKNLGVHRATLYRWIKIYQKCGSRISALLPSRPLGGKGASRLDYRVEDIVTEKINLLYLSKQKRNIVTVWKNVAALCKEQDLSPPTYNTLRKRINALSAYEKIKHRTGAKEAREATKIHRGRFDSTEFPLELVQIDHTPTDLILVDEVTRLPIGRPWLTLAIDVYSRMIMGYYLTLDPPGSLSIGMCLVHAILPKDSWLAKNDIKASWPCWGVPDAIHADNGKDFRSRSLQRSCQEYGINIEWRPLAHPNYGGHIERLLGTFMREFHNLPGTTFSSIAERGSYDSTKHAAFTLRECEIWLVNYITGIYHQHPHSGIMGQCPLKRYEEGIIGSSTKIGRGLPPKITDEQRLYLDFLPGVTRTIQRFGVQIDNITYFADELRPYATALDLEHPAQKAKFLFKRDPRNISVIYFFVPATMDYCVVPYRNPAYPAISIWELRDAQRKIRETHKGQIDERTIFETIEKLHRIEEMAVAKTAKERRKLAQKRNHQELKERENVIEKTVDLHSKSTPSIFSPGLEAWPQQIMPFENELSNLEKLFKK